MSVSVPVSVIIITKNEEARLEACLKALTDFDEVIVVDSNSSDNTQNIARKHGAKIVPYEWNGKYPKKRGWCLQNLETTHDFIFFVDADEIVTKELITEIQALPFIHDGYFVKGRYVINGKAMKYGLVNNKLCLFNRRKFIYPEIDDLDLEGMGELEGHYQPVPIDASVTIGQLNAPLLHYACEDWDEWRERHTRYAAWESGMNRKKAWPEDPVKLRQSLKTIFRTLPLRGTIAFLHCYLLKGGILDGARGFALAKHRAWYYNLIK